MKYWVFQSNQVIGPYDNEDLSRLVSFTPESLVCPEGRKGTSMGDWQRAGMVPDLSVALVKSSQRQPARGGLATLSGLPPEPTLKDLAVLGSLQEKVAMLEDVAAQLQESLRQKEAELSAVHGALADKDREAASARAEAERQQREADELKRQLAGLEERLSSVAALGETLDKAVEAEKQVQGDVLKQGETIAALSRELEELRGRLDSRAAAPAPAFEPPSLAPEPAAHVLPPEPAAALDIGLPSVPPPALPPLPAVAPDASAPAFDIEMPAAEPLASLAPAPAPVATPSPALDFPAPAAAAPEPSTFPGGDTLLSSEPLPFAPQSGALDPLGGGSLAPTPTPEPAGAVDMMAPEAEAKPKKGKALLVGVLLGAVVMGGAAYYAGLIPGLAPSAPAPVVEAPVAPPEPVAPSEPAPDPRQEAVAFAKAWSISRGMTLGAKLDAVAPASGSLSPWMAEALPDGRIQVNYFASGAAAGSPTIAYEFVVDLAGKTLSGRNAAAKSILTGKLPAPPKPAAARAVRVRPKAKPVLPADDESLDSLLGGEEPAPKPAPAAKGDAMPMPGYKTGPVTPKEPADPLDEGSLEGVLDEEPKPAPKAKGRPSRGGKKPAADEGKASDEALLDDLLEE